MLVAAPAAWVIADALALVRELQPQLHAIKWHVALGGGVLNKGESYKDVDLYFMPFSDTETTDDVFPFLVGLWGAGEPIGIGYQPTGIFAVKWKWVVGGKRIDTFIGRRGALKEAA